MIRIISPFQRCLKCWSLGRYHFTIDLDSAPWDTTMVWELLHPVTKAAPEWCQKWTANKIKSNDHVCTLGELSRPTKIRSDRHSQYYSRRKKKWKENSNFESPNRDRGLDGTMIHPDIFWFAAVEIGKEFTVVLWLSGPIHRSSPGSGCCSLVQPARDAQQKIN